MPWTSNDATRHTKKASTPKRKRQWSAIANSVLARGGTEGSAVRQANGVIKTAMDAAQRAMRRKHAKSR